jgi:transcriptional regulator with XRE-family HTH domain
MHVDYTGLRNSTYDAAVKDWTPEEIRRARQSVGWTQKQLAEKLSVSTRAVNAWEAGENEPESRRGMLDKLFPDDEPTPQPSIVGFSDGELLGELTRRIAELRRLNRGAQPRAGRVGQVGDVADDPPVSLVE